MTPTAAHPVTYGLDASFPTFSVARYQRMIEAGILTPDDKVELLENYLVRKMPRNPPHDGTIQRASKRLRRHLPAGWDLRTQSAVALADSQPEPDLAVVPERPDDYTTGHPTAADVALLIEVADSSLLRDQRDKARIYARAGVPVYWIVNLVDRRIEVHTDPTGPAAAPEYRAVGSYGPTEQVPLTLGGAAAGPVPAADLLP